RSVSDPGPGMADALAILPALAPPEVSGGPITPGAATVGADLSTENISRALDVARPPRRPRVAQGAAAPLRQPLVTAPHVHGPDGLGNLERFTEPGGGPRYGEPFRFLETLDGADLILQTIKEFPDELVLVALG